MADQQPPEAPHAASSEAPPAASPEAPHAASSGEPPVAPPESP